MRRLDRHPAGWCAGTCAASQCACVFLAGLQNHRTPPRRAFTNRVRHTQKERSSTGSKGALRCHARWVMPRQADPSAGSPRAACQPSLEQASLEKNATHVSIVYCDRMQIVRIKKNE